MQVLPLNFFSYKRTTSQVQNKAQNTNMTTGTGQVLLSQPIVTTVSFQGTAKNAEPLRKLMAYRIPDMYSGKIVIERCKVEAMLSNYLFSKNIKNIVKALLPYEESLFPIEKAVFSKIKSAAAIDPHAKLDATLHALAPEHNQKLIQIQQPIFDDLKNMSKSLPLEKQDEFNRLMEMVEKKVQYQPVVIPFNPVDFQYKLKRIADQISAKNNAYETSLITQMMHISKNFPSEGKENLINIETCHSKAKRNKKLQSLKKIEKQKINILKKLDTLRLSSILRYNQELEKLLVMAGSQINGIPIISPFNRKSFIHDLQQITDTIENKKLAHKMVQKAIQLPTSHNNISAFIVKYANSSSEKIGYSLLSGSIGNIEHLQPFVKGGKDCLENYGISCEYTNSDRGFKSMAQQLIQHPEIYKNCQKQVDRLIELYNCGIFKKVGLSKFYIINFVRKMYKLSPQNKPLTLDLSKLK